MVFVDTNILVYSTNEDSPFQEIARARLQQLADEYSVLCISNQVLREYVGVVTRIAITKRQYDPALIKQDVTCFEKQFYVLQEDKETRRRLLDLLAYTVIGGKQVHDANLIATALQFDIPNFCTHNVADFKRFDSLITIIPLIDQN